MKASELAKYIDHTLLKPDATEEQIKKLCAEAKEYNFASVCINPIYVSLAATLLKNSDVKVCTVVGFPLGANLTATKVFETKQAIEDGAEEIDMVIANSVFKTGNYDWVQEDIKEVVKACKGKAIVKVIIETSLLSDEEIVQACNIAKAAGAHFVKTSTGFIGGGATEAHIKLMRETVGEDMGVKASGGVRTYDDAIKMIKAGASRIGASAGVKIVSEAEE